MKWMITEEEPYAEYGLTLRERHGDLDRFGQSLYGKILKEFESPSFEAAKVVFEGFMDDHLKRK